MKKLLAAILAIIVIITFAGCEKLPEEPEPTRTPSSSTPEPKDYYSDSDEEASEPEDTDSTEGEEGEEGEEDIETSEEEDDSEEEEPAFRYTRRTREEIEAELNQGIEKDEDGARVGQDLTGRYRIIPPAGGWTGARGGVVKKETPAAQTPVIEPEPEPEPTKTPTKFTEKLIFIQVQTPVKPDALIIDQVPMFPIDALVTEMAELWPDSFSIEPKDGLGNERLISVNKEYLSIDLLTGKCVFEGSEILLSTPPKKISVEEGEVWFVPMELFGYTSAMPTFHGDRFDFYE